MSNPDQNNDVAERNARMKDYSRESRLSFRKFAEHQLRRDLKDEALEICKPHVEAFAACAQEKGLMVVFSCKHLHQEVQQCLALHNGEEAWERYKEKHKDKLEVKK
jgi:Cytochrome c oxidase biogenesis protein Cmc1 like